MNQTNSTHGNAVSATIDLPTSKSISNRALIIAALENAAFTQISNLSTANDTQLLMRLLKQEHSDYNCEDAGTTLRFLLSYLALRNRPAIVTGSPRMCERPIGDLVDALNALGFDISYIEKTGFPPLRVSQIKNLNTLSNSVQLSSSVSSQFLSSLLMIAPKLPNGLKIQLHGEIASRPYIEMTLAVMKHFGVSAKWSQENQLSVLPQAYTLVPVSVEPDWSNASYFYSIVALCGGKLRLPNLRLKSLQGDAIIADIMTSFAVKTFETESGIEISKQGNAVREFSYDFTNCPDLAQTIIVLCAALGILAKFSGLASLKVKETNRIAALQSELAKIAKDLKETENGVYSLNAAAPVFPSELLIETYADHRMAMAFAPLGALTSVQFTDATVVQKSFPHFWQEIAKCALNIQVKK
jgi:3-phosphoshikimate 1-carboxyvinyltransferase